MELETGSTQVYGGEKNRSAETSTKKLTGFNVSGLFIAKMCWCFSY
jgi:hypothetical protein